MLKIGIVGSNGFLGRTLSNASKNFDYDINNVTRKNFEHFKKEKFDVLINTATPSKKYWASNNPHLDFQATVSLTADLVYNWNYEKFIQISSLSVNDSKSNHPYAINKKAAEVISSYKKSLIVRLSNLYGKGLNKGPLYDLLINKKIYVDIASEYSFIDTKFVANWILKNLNREGVVQLGAQDTISLQEIASKLNLEIDWEGGLERIYSNNLEPNMPACNEIWDFIYEFINIQNKVNL